MYCKWFITCLIIFTVLVLIVAKCIVNGINELAGLNATIVLIVAKCIVNIINQLKAKILAFVLIVAKCIVNLSTIL